MNNKNKFSMCVQTVKFLCLYSQYILAKLRHKQLTLRLLFMLSNCLCVHSPMLCEPHSSIPTRAYVNVIDPIGRKYVRNMNTTLYL